MIAVEHVSEERWTADSGEKWSARVFCSTPGCPLRDIAVASDYNPNLFVFLTGQASQGGVGKAYVGTACYLMSSTWSKRRRMSLTKYRFYDEYTAELIAHEIGHNLGEV